VDYGRESSIAEENVDSAFEKADLSLRQFVEDVVATNPRVKQFAYR